VDGVGPVTITHTNTPDAGDADAVAKAIAQMLNDIPQLRTIAQRLVDNAIEKLKFQGEVDPGTANLIRLNILETLADDLKARGAGRFAIKRVGNIIEGYQKTNLKEFLKDYIDGWSGMMTKQDAALEFLEELKEIPRNKPQLMGYASKYSQDTGLFSTTDTRIQGTISTSGADLNMSSLNIALGATQTIDQFQLTFPASN